MEACVGKAVLLNLHPFYIRHKQQFQSANLPVWVNTEEAVIRETELCGCSSFAFFVIHKFTVSVSVVNNSLYCTNIS